MVLFILPHAGGSAKSYSTFKRFLPKDWKIIPMELSGRFTRANEPFITDISKCVEDLIQLHNDNFKDEYSVFGHSMGSLLAVELVRQAKIRGLNLPHHVFVSGRCAPDENINLLSDTDNISDDDIVEFFSDNSIMPEILLKDAELKKMLNSVLCRDVRMADRYSVTPEDGIFDCDITVMYGQDDSLLKNCDMEHWSKFTKGRCNVISFSGNHFYYNEHKKEICNIIEQTLTSCK